MNTLWTSVHSGVFLMICFLMACARLFGALALFDFTRLVALAVRWRAQSIPLSALGGLVRRVLRGRACGIIAPNIALDLLMVWRLFHLGVLSVGV